MENDRPDKSAPSCCCAGKSCVAAPARTTPGKFVTGAVASAIGPVPSVATRWTASDLFGAVKVRASIGRMNYAVEPGLYAVGNPGAASEVLVSANYKLSFDKLRRSLGGRDAWILVLDTKAINVWCAAGKGTFGTGELVRRIQESRLAEVVEHRKLVLPQLGAPGVAAREVLKATGFHVVWGPIRAEDLPAFMNAGMVATPAMRRKSFGLAERAVLIPGELAIAARHGLLPLLALFMLSGLKLGSSYEEALLGSGLMFLAAAGAALLAGAVCVPLLLPWLPGRAFSLKGLLPGLAAGAGAALLFGVPATAGSWLEASAVLLAVPATASFLAMNFTGASTYTSLSGVRREMRTAVPIQIAAGIAALGLWAIARFVA